MATMSSGNEKLPMEIRTRSIEQTLIPLVTQITTLVNAKEKPIKSHKTLAALSVVGQTVNQAVERFVSVGEAIARENEDICAEMGGACREARDAGVSIERLTACTPSSTPGSSPDGSASSSGHSAARAAEKTSMVRAARQLLSAITKVLVLADRVVVKQLLAAKDKVILSLNKIESATNFTEFVKTFSQFGNEMVTLAHHTGDRQNDLKSEKARAQMGAARSILEKSTMMLLTTSKAFLRHPDCASARLNRDGVVSQMRRSLEVVHHVVTDGISPQDLVEMTRVTMINAETSDKIRGALEAVQESTQDFTDSAYTPHNHRERIISLLDGLRSDVTSLQAAGAQLEQEQTTSPSAELDAAIGKCKEATQQLKKQLLETALAQAGEVFRGGSEHELLGVLKQTAMAGDSLRVEELTIRFDEYTDQLLEVCKLLRHVAGSEPLLVWAEHAENLLKTVAQQIIHSAHTLTAHGTSKIAKENLDVFMEAYVTAVNDLSALVKEELSRIAKLGLEMKLVTSEMDAETEKWQDPDNEVVRRAKNMSGMAFSVYLFTRREGALKTTADLFSQAEVFNDEGARLFKCVKDFTSQVPQSPHKLELLQSLERVPICCQRLNYSLKSPTIGKAATFTKVSEVIHDSMALLSAVSQVLTTCYICATKFNIDYRGRPSSAAARWRPGADMLAVNGGRDSPRCDVSSPRSTGSEAGSDRESVKSVRSARSDYAHAHAQPGALMRSASLNRAINGPGEHRYDRI